jgi:hypothetical protein
MVSDLSIIAFYIYFSINLRVDLFLTLSARIARIGKLTWKLPASIERNLQFRYRFVPLHSSGPS